MALEEFDELTAPVVGGDDNAWGTILNNINATWARQLAGWVTINVGSGDVTLDSTQAQMRGISVEGSPTANRTVWLQEGKPRFYFVTNNVATSNPWVVHFRVGLNAFVIVPNGAKMMIAVDPNDATFACSLPADGSGRMPNQILDNGGTYRPGLAFEGDWWAGFSWRGSGVLGISPGSMDHDAVRLQSGNSNTAPRLSIGGPSYKTGFTLPWDHEIGFVADGNERARIGSYGMVVGQPAGWMLGHGWLNVQGGIAINGQRWAPKDVGGMTPVAKGMLSTNHGLGYTPRWVQPYLQCVTGDRGYSVGDRIQGGWGDYMSVCWYNSTQVGLTMWGRDDDLMIRPKTGGSHINATLSSWRLWFSVA